MGKLMTDAFEKIAADAAKDSPFVKALAQGQAIEQEFDRFFIHRALAVSVAFIALAIAVVIF